MTFINFTDAQYADTAQHWSTTHWLGGYVQGGYLADQQRKEINNNSYLLSRIWYPRRINLTTGIRLLL